MATLLSFALVGTVGTLSAALTVAIGAVLASWSLEHLEVTRSHPAVVAVLETCAVAAAIGRAVPWRPLRAFAATPPRDGTGHEPGELDPGTLAASDRAPLQAVRDAWSALDGLSAIAWAGTVVVSGALVAIVMYRHVLVHLGTQMHGAPGDRDWYLFVGWKIGQALRHGSSPFHLQGITSPHGYNVFVGDGFLPPTALGLVNFVLRPVAAYNLMLMLSTLLSLVSGVVLASRITKRRVVHLLVGASLATTPVVFLRLQGHFSLCFIFPIALVAAEAVDLARPGGRVRPLRLALWLLLAFGSTVYFLLIALGVLAAATAVRLVAERAAWRPIGRSLAIAAAIVVLVMSPFLLQRTRLTNDEVAHGSTVATALRTDGESYNADVLSEALPTYPSSILWPGSNRFARNIVVTSGEGNLSFPGLALVTLGVGGLIATRRRWARVFLVAAATLWLLSLGPVADVFGIVTVTPPGATWRTHWLPFEALGRIPMLSALRAPGRLSLGIPALLAVGLAIALDETSRTRRGRSNARAAKLLPVAIVALVALTFVPNIPTLATQPPAVATASARAMLESLRTRPGPPGRAVPVPSCVGNLTGVESSLQIWHQLELVGCQGPYLALPFASRMGDYRASGDLAALRCTPDVLGYVTTQFASDDREISPGLGELRKDFSVRYLVIDATSLGTCPGLAALVARLGTAFEVIPGDSRWSVIDLATPRGS